MLRRTFTRSQRGAAAIEYGILAAVIAAVVVVAVVALGNSATESFDCTKDAWNSKGTMSC